MSIDRAYAPGWGVGEMFTSAQGNAIDINITNALDKRSGYGDILQSVVVCAGAGRIISSVQTGPNADTTWHPNGGNMIVRVPTLTAARSYTLGHTGATGGDKMSFYVEGTGASPSGYVDIKNNVGTGLFRLGMVRTGTGMSEQAEGDNAEFIFVGSGWQLMKGAGPGMRAIPYLADAIWVAPPSVHKLQGFGCAGGAGGGGGKANSTAGNRWISGGGGGGGALYCSAVVDVVPGRAYEIYIGAGGAGGAAGSAGDPGGNTGIYDPILGDFILLFRGAQGGRTQVTTYGVSSSGTYRAHGGSPNAFINRSGWGNFADDMVMDSVPSGILSFGIDLPAGSGGAGNGTDTGVAGSPNGTGSTSHSGGSGGAKGADSGTERGGGGGGGGGAGPFGPGAAGGAGGAGGTPGAGAAGSSAAANTGAGGGGGGSGGTAGAGSGAGGAGGNGGSGRLTLVYVK